MIIICEVERFERDYITPLYNKKGFPLAFEDKAHAEYFVKTHKSVLKPNIIYRECAHANDLYKPYNIWQYEENYINYGKRYM